MGMCAGRCARGGAHIRSISQPYVPCCAPPSPSPPAWRALLLSLWGAYHAQVQPHVLFGSSARPRWPLTLCRPRPTARPPARRDKAEWEGRVREGLGAGFRDPELVWLVANTSCERTCIARRC